MASQTITLAQKIRGSEKTKTAITASLKTDNRILARITDGIYRQPASALRELISNAYDADATEVIISTDAPRFSVISVRDDGHGLTPEILEHLIQHIGGSAKRNASGQELGVTHKNNPDRSPRGRQLIGKMGIGLLSVAQFTRHFLVITKTLGDNFRTIADITLGPVSRDQDANLAVNAEIEAGSAKMWREKSDDVDAHGTEVKLLEMLPRTKAELASEDLWSRIALEKESNEPESTQTKSPTYHIGRMKPGQTTDLEFEQKLPWSEKLSPDERFACLIETLREVADGENEAVDLDIHFDRYLQTLWNLALSAPLPYYESHPFDVTAAKKFNLFQIANEKKGQAIEVTLKGEATPRTLLSLESPSEPKEPFRVIMDGVSLRRPILFSDLPQTKSALKDPMLCVGSLEQKFEGKPITLSGGPLKFEAYLFWAPKIIPKQHQGVMLRVGNASGASFDRTFMGYQVAEMARTRQITAEVFVIEGLDGAINIDRESFNYAHPHYQYIVKWLHSALRQIANKQKEMSKSLRDKVRATDAKRVKAQIETKVEASLESRGVEEVPEVVFAKADDNIKQLRRSGAIVLPKEIFDSKTTNRQTGTGAHTAHQLAQKKAVAITQLLHGWGLMGSLTYAERERLLRDIFEVVVTES